MLLKPGATTGTLCVFSSHDPRWLLSRKALSLNAMHGTALLQTIRAGWCKLPGNLVRLLACLMEGAATPP